ncbi:MAG TPA: GIY-YIG nuclease family protein [Gemmatimonadaceae bacterium]|nr:GIY-YIG nuclease family protein [Gemmatimonadaceae bacterium]
MQRQFYVYILASKSRRLYVGVTSNLERRLTEHRLGLSRFTAGYRINRLVYVETYQRPMTAIIREKQLKGWSRAKKIALVTKGNPAWDDLLPPSSRGASATKDLLL